MIDRAEEAAVPQVRRLEQVGHGVHRRDGSPRLASTFVRLLFRDAARPRVELGRQLVVVAQTGAVVLAGAPLARVVPPGFYYEGQSAPTQARNSAAARFGKDRYVFAGLVDTSGYSADVRASFAVGSARCVIVP